jgi:PilZ domain
MDKLNTDVQSSNWQMRKYRRFSLECPVRMKVQSDVWPAEVETISKNVSIGGLLVRSPSLIPQNATVIFMMRIQDDEAVRPIHLVGRGQIVRVENAPDATFLIALQCKDLVTQLEEYLPV